MLLVGTSVLDGMGSSSGAPASKRRTTKSWKTDVVPELGFSFSGYGQGPAPVDVGSLDYQDRQRLVVVTDPVARSLREASEQARAGDPEGASQALVNSMAVGASAGVVATVGAAIGVYVASAALSALVDQLRRWRGSEPPFLTIGRSESKQLRFPPGHPHDNFCTSETLSSLRSTTSQPISMLERSSTRPRSFSASSPSSEQHASRPSSSTAGDKPAAAPSRHRS